MIKYSVIVPNRNNGKDIRQCLQSIKDQNYEDYEVRVYDNNSTDDSVKIVEEFLDDPRFSLKIITDGHPAPSRNIQRGLEACTGEVALWLNSDDYMLPGYFTTASIYFKNPKVGFVSIGVKAIHPDKPDEILKPAMINKTDLGNVLRLNLVFPSSPFRRKFFFDVGGIDDIIILFDWDFWVRAIINGVAFQGWEYRICDKPLAVRRIHKAQIENMPYKGMSFKTHEEWRKFSRDQVFNKYVRKEMPNGSVIQKPGPR